MKMMAILFGLVLSLLLFPGVAVVHRTSLDGEKVVPPIENVASDKKFYGPPFPADYPDDMSPKAGKDLNPKKHDPTYPAIQSGNSDHDYIHDENDDGGEWEAQMAYDNSRVKYTKEHQLSEEAQKRLRKESSEADKAKTKFEDASQADDEAEKQKKAAEADEKAAEVGEQRVKDVASKAEAEAKKHADEILNRTKTKKKLDHEIEESENRLKEAQEKYVEAENAFKKCKDEHNKAQADLADAQHIDEALRQRQADIMGEGAGNLPNEDYSDELTAAHKKVEAAEAKVKATKAHKDVVEAKEHAEEETYKREKHEEEQAQVTVDKTSKREEEAAYDLEAAKRKLRNIRDPPRNGAVHAGSSLIALSLACGLVVF